MINITKKQHFVPQFYLKQFAGENGMLCCYRKNDGKQFSAHPKDICFKDYGYEVQASHGKNKFILPNEIEKMFSMIEREYSTVLRSIVDKCLINLDKTALICTLKEKEVLASMVANFISRNFFVVNSFIDEDETLDLLQNKEIIEIDNLLREMNLGNIRPLVELSQQKIFLSPTEDGITKKITGNLLNLNLSFFVTKSRNFVTSDCPVGYNCSTEEFFMARIPLTPRITAVYSNSEFSRQFKNKSLLIEDRFVKKINQDYFNWDIPQLIIAKSKDDIQMLMKKI